VFVADYTAVIVGVVLAFIVILVLLTRMITVIQPGQVGLVFVLGAYKTGILPGFNLVAPMASVVKVTPGSGPNRALGMLGVAETALAPDRPPGSVRIGEMQLTARSATPIRAGTTVRVIQDSTVGTVLVAEEHEHPGGPKVPKPPSDGAPLRESR
jgi:membrane-bound ClpP family serine protease